MRTRMIVCLMFAAAACERHDPAATAKGELSTPMRMSSSVSAGATGGSTAANQASAAVTAPAASLASAAAASDTQAAPSAPIPVAKQVDVAALVGEPGANAELASAPIKLPSKWSGNGVLARRTEKVPRGAPSWTKVEAEVTEHDGKRVLSASGSVKKIKDAQLARTTAENRARALLSAWTKSSRQTEGSVREFWRDARTGETFVQVELPVPPSWVPGTPIETP